MPQIEPIAISIPKDIAKDSRTFLFFECINRDLFALNELIRRYLEPHDPDQRFETLKSIYQQRLEILNRYPLDKLILHPAYYDQLLNGLWEALKEAFLSLGVATLTNLQTLDRRALPPPLMTREFADILSNMSQAKCEKLMDLLLPPSTFDGLLTLYKPTEPDYAIFQNFITQNTIAFLGGSNSKIFKITPKSPSNPPYILKIDGRLRLPKAPELHLRSKGTLALTRTYGQERQVALTDRRQFFVSTLLVADYFPQKDLFSQIQAEQILLSSKKIYVTALNRALQMGRIFQDMQQKGIAFPDAKNENWLLDPEGQLKIADTKSLLFIEDDGCIHIEKSKLSGRNQWQSLCSTHTHRPNEFLKDAMGDHETLCFSVDRMHCYMLGKNLYQMLTGCQPHDLTYKSLDFYSHFFMAPEERAHHLKKLIIRMTAHDSKRRASLSEAMDGLTKLISEPELLAVRIQWLQRDCHSLLSQLAPLISEEAFYGFTTKINQAKTLNDYQARYDELAAALTTIHIELLDQRIAAYQELLKRPELSNEADLISQLSILHALKTEAYSLQQIDALKKTDRLLKRYQRYLENTQSLGDLKEETLLILNTLAGISPDPATSAYIQAQFPPIASETNPIHLLKRQDELKILGKQLKKVRQSLDKVLEPSPTPGFFKSFGKKESPDQKTTAQSRAEKIRQAFQALPPLDRIQIFSRNSPPIQAFKEALDTDEREAGECNAERYKKFKANYAQSIYVPQSDDEEEDRLSMPKR